MPRYTEEDAKERYNGQCQEASHKEVNEGDRIFQIDDAIYYCSNHRIWVCSKCKNKHEDKAIIEYQLQLYKLREPDRLYVKLAKHPW